MFMLGFDQNGHGQLLSIAINRGARKVAWQSGAFCELVNLYTSSKAVKSTALVEGIGGREWPVRAIAAPSAVHHAKEGERYSPNTASIALKCGLTLFLQETRTQSRARAGCVHGLEAHNWRRIAGGDQVVRPELALLRNWSHIVSFEECLQARTDLPADRRRISRLRHRRVW
jgi:hypothetical protein